MRRLTLILFLVGILVLGQIAPQSTAKAADRAIEPVAGDVYRFKNKFHYALFVVTADGIVVTDPINADEMW